MRLYRCAVCGNENYIGYELCKNCWSEWTVTGTMPKPIWLLELVRMEYSFQSTKASFEYVFSDIECGEDEHKIEKALLSSELNA